VIELTTGLIFHPHQGGTTTDALVEALPASLFPASGADEPAAKPEVTPDSATTIPNIDVAIPTLVATNLPFLISYPFLGFEVSKPYYVFSAFLLRTRMR
jgi:hypothetical protein